MGQGWSWLIIFLKFLRTSFLKFYMISSHCASSAPLEPKTSISPTISIDRPIVDIVYLFLASRTAGDGRHLMFIHNMTQFDINCIIKCHQKNIINIEQKRILRVVCHTTQEGDMKYDIERGKENFIHLEISVKQSNMKDRPSNGSCVFLYTTRQAEANRRICIVCA